MQQDDLFVDTLTVLEQLEFYAALKMDKVDKDMKRARIEEVMQELGLERCKNTKIGKPGQIKVCTCLLRVVVHVDPCQLVIYWFFLTWTNSLQRICMTSPAFP